MIADTAAGAQDRANAVRFLECFEFLISSEPAHVEVLFAREWTVRGKPYRVTWSTGAFIQQLNELYVQNASAPTMQSPKRKKIMT